MDTSLNNKSGVPGLIKALSILYYIFVGLYILFAILIFTAGGFLSLTFPFIGTLGGLSFIFQGIIALVFAGFLFFLAKGLWNGKNSARIASLIFIGAGIVKNILDYFIFDSKNMLSFVINLILGLIIISYLLWNKKVKNAFS